MANLEKKQKELLSTRERQDKTWKRISIALVILIAILVVLCLISSLSTVFSSSLVTPDSPSMTFAYNLGRFSFYYIFFVILPCFVLWFLYAIYIMFYNKAVDIE